LLERREGKTMRDPDDDAGDQQLEAAAAADGQ
jgi:hypothetical protein